MDFADYRKRIKTVEHFISPTFFIDNKALELDSVEQMVDALARLHSDTWFFHSPAGSGKSTLFTYLMHQLLDRDIACVRISSTNLVGKADYTKPHKLVKSLRPQKVNKALWEGRARKKRGKIVVFIDGVNEIQQAFEGQPQWHVVLELLNGNHNFPVLAASRYIPDQLDLEESERAIYSFSLRPFSQSQIRTYLRARGLNPTAVLDHATASGMRDAVTNPFLLLLIADHSVGNQGFAGDWPRCRAELLRRTFADAGKGMSQAQKTLQESQGLSQEVVCCAAALAVAALRESVLPLSELDALLKRVWHMPEQSEAITDFCQSFIKKHLVDYTAGKGWRFIHDSLVDFGLALACSDMNHPPAFAFLPAQFDTFLGDWVGLQADPDAAALQVITQAQEYAIPEKLIDVAIANRGILSLDTLNTLWRTVGAGLLSTRRIKSRVADRLGDLPFGILREARRRQLLRPLQKKHVWLAKRVGKTLDKGYFNGAHLTEMERTYNRLSRANNLPKKSKSRQNTAKVLTPSDVAKIHEQIAN